MKLFEICNSNFQLTEPNEENEIKVIAESFMPGMQHLLTLVNFQFVSLLYSGPYRDKTDLTTDNQPTSFHSSINDGKFLEVKVF